MSIPNCVPEYYREKEEAEQKNYERIQKKLEEIKNGFKVGEYNAATRCSACQSLLGINYGDETEWYCKLSECTIKDRKVCKYCNMFISDNEEYTSMKIYDVEIYYHKRCLEIHEEELKRREIEDISNDSEIPF